LKRIDLYRQSVYNICMTPKQLKLWRKKNSYSQVNLAKVLGVDVMTVSRWERGMMKNLPPFLKLALKYLEGKEIKK